MPKARTKAQHARAKRTQTQKKGHRKGRSAFRLYAPFVGEKEELFYRYVVPLCKAKDHATCLAIISEFRHAWQLKWPLYRNPVTHHSTYARALEEREQIIHRQFILRCDLHRLGAYGDLPAPEAIGMTAGMPVTIPSNTPTTAMPSTGLTRLPSYSESALAPISFVNRPGETDPATLTVPVYAEASNSAGDATSSRDTSDGPATVPIMMDAGSAASLPGSSLTSGNDNQDDGDSDSASSSSSNTDNSTLSTRVNVHGPPLASNTNPQRTPLPQPGATNPVNWQVPVAYVPRLSGYYFPPTGHTGVTQPHPQAPSDTRTQTQGFVPNQWIGAATIPSLPGGPRIVGNPFATHGQYISATPYFGPFPYVQLPMGQRAAPFQPRYYLSQPNTLTGGPPAPPAPQVAPSGSEIKSAEPPTPNQLTLRYLADVALATERDTLAGDPRDATTVSRPIVVNAPSAASTVSRPIVLNTPSTNTVNTQPHPAPAPPPLHLHQPKGRYPANILKTLTVLRPPHFGPSPGK